MDLATIKHTHRLFVIDSIVDFINDLLELDIDFQSLLPFVAIYVTLVWAMFSVWLFLDARRRYNNVFIALAFFLLVLPYNFPALVFYLIIRPETEEELLHHVGLSDGHHEGGVQVPVVNFVNEKGDVEFGFSLKISNTHIAKQMANSMKVDVAWESDSKDYEVDMSSVENGTDKAEKKIKINTKTKTKKGNEGLVHKLKENLSAVLAVPAAGFASLTDLVSETLEKVRLPKTGVEKPKDEAESKDVEKEKDVKEEDKDEPETEDSEDTTSTDDDQEEGSLDQDEADDSSEDDEPATEEQDEDSEEDKEKGKEKENQNQKHKE